MGNKMANIKEVNIIGWMPFNCNETKELQPYLAAFSTPSFGLNISYYEILMVPNENKGKTTFYRFYVDGQEALRNEWLDGFFDALEMAGALQVGGNAWDIENDRDLIWNRRSLK